MWVREGGKREGKGKGETGKEGRNERGKDDRKGREGKSK